jgi:hypothetical protein
VIKSPLIGFLLVFRRSLNFIRLLKDIEVVSDVSVFKVGN